MRNSLLLVAACVLFTAACHSSRSGGEPHSGNARFEIPEDVRQKIPKLAEHGKYDEALDLLRPYAEQGNPEAQFGMAVGLIEKGDRSNDVEIVQWARRSGKQDYPQALSFLANAYQWGWYGLPSNTVMAVMWTSAETNAAMIAKCLDYEHNELKVTH